MAESSDGPRVFYPQCRAIMTVILDGFGSSARDSQQLVIPCLPKSATVHINSYKQADSAELVFDIGDLPLDPQMIRAGSVELYMFQAEAADDRTRIVSRRQPLVESDPADLRTRDPLETLTQQMETPSSRDRFTLGERKPRIAGTFDDADVELSNSGKWLSIKIQDYTAYLAATQFKPDERGYARKIPLGKRLDLTVRDLLEEADPDGVLSVRVHGIDPATLPIVGRGETRSNKRGIPVEQDTSYWDVIYKIVTRYGFIAYVDALDVVIGRPKTITDRDQASIRRMAWGKNLESLNLRRHLGKEQAPTIVVRSYDPATRQVLTAEYPTGQISREATVVTGGKKPKVKRRVKESTRKSKSGKTKTTIKERDEYQIITVRGITDPEALARIAENHFHLLGKAERKVTATTRDLCDLRFSNLLDVTAGDAFTIEWDEFNRELLANPGLTKAQKAAHLVERGFNTEIADAIATHYEALTALRRPLRFREGTISFDVESGIQIEMELQDFVVNEGIRPADEGETSTPQESTIDRNRAARTKADGSPIGWSKAYEDAQRRRFGR